MLTSNGNGPTLVSDMQPKFTVMLVMARERRLSLLEALEDSGIDVLAVCECNEARQILKTQLPVQVVLTDRALPDGDWRDVLEIVARGHANVQVVVCSRPGDHTLVMDVLEQGAYDVLIEPYQHDEIQQVLEGAAARSYMHSKPPARAMSYQHTVRAAGA